MSTEAELNTLWGWKNDRPLQTYEHARELALEQLAEDPSMESITLTQYYEPGLADVPDMLGDILGFMKDAIYEDERLYWNDGGAYLDVKPESPEGAALRTALDAYIAAHVDLSAAAWIPTGAEHVLTRADLQVEVQQ